MFINKPGPPIILLVCFIVNDTVFLLFQYDVQKILQDKRGIERGLRELTTKGTVFGVDLQIIIDELILHLYSQIRYVILVIFILNFWMHSISSDFTFSVIIGKALIFPLS